MEVKQTIESTEENRKTEKVTKIESKLTTAEQNREKEIQRKLEIIKKNVGIWWSGGIFVMGICQWVMYHLDVCR